MHVKVDKFMTGRGYPKVKNSLYCDPFFVTKVSDMSSETILEKPNEAPENVLDLIPCKTQTIYSTNTQILQQTTEQALTAKHQP